MFELIKKYWRRKLLLKLIKLKPGSDFHTINALYRLALEAPPLSTPNKGQDKPL